MFESYTANLYMDYDGQRRAEYFFEVIIFVSSVLGFALGYHFQMFSVTLAVLAIGSLFSVLLTIPPWPIYRRHPLKWQKPRD